MLQMEEAKQVERDLSSYQAVSAHDGRVPDRVRVGLVVRAGLRAGLAVLLTCAGVCLLLAIARRQSAPMAGSESQWASGRHNVRQVLTNALIMSQSNDNHPKLASLANAFDSPTHTGNIYHPNYSQDGVPPNVVGGTKNSVFTGNYHSPLGCPQTVGPGTYSNPFDPEPHSDDCLGCDGVLDSGKVLDACGVCGGNGLSCGWCDGIPDSGNVFDACGVCGGQSSDPTNCGGTRRGKEEICGGDKTVHSVSCRDTVANGNDACHPGERMTKDEYTLVYALCAESMNRFHGNVGDIYTVRCPGGCDQDEAAIVYGPGNGDDSKICDQYNEGTKFLDHSSICRAAIAKGVLSSGPGLVHIRLVEPLASYPSCSSMPHESSFVHQIDGEAWVWPEWQKADITSNVKEFGPPSDCCNYTVREEDTEWTPEGGGCCAVQRFRQKWIPKLRQQKCPDRGCRRRGVFGSSWGIGNFWIGVRAFEILDKQKDGKDKDGKDKDGKENKEKEKEKEQDDGDDEDDKRVTCSEILLKKPNEDDCRAELKNAENNGNLDYLYERCRTEGGSRPIKVRCPQLCCKKGDGGDEDDGKKHLDKRVTCNNKKMARASEPMSSDCASEMSNAKNNNKLDDLYERCGRQDKDGLDFRKRCPQICCKPEEDKQKDGKKKDGKDKDGKDGKDKDGQKKDGKKKDGKENKDDGKKSGKKGDKGKKGKKNK
jgi:hypothetical protein